MNIKKILKKELKETFRDKKSLAMMLIIPFMIPLIVFGMSALFDMEVNKSESEYNHIGFAYTLSEVEESLLHSMNIDYQVASESDLKSLLDEEKIDLYVTKEGNKYAFHASGDVDSNYSGALITSYFEAYKSSLQASYLADKEVPADEVLNIISYGYAEDGEPESQSEYFSKYIVNYAFLFIIMAITVSATYPATDATAGERERGTLETLLTLPIKNRDIIVGKYLSVTISSLITGLISFILMCVSLMLVNTSFDIYEGVRLLPSISSLIFALVVIVNYSGLISGLCVAIASKAKTFKEAQGALTPLNFISFFPSMIAFMVEIKSSAVLSLVPFLNYTLLFTDIVNGSVSVFYIVLMLASSIIYIILVLSVNIKQYSSEKVLFSN